MKLMYLFLLGLLISCQPAAIRTAVPVPGASIGDQENSLGDELFNNVWYRDRAPGVVTSYSFEPDGSLIVRGLDANDLDSPVFGYDENWNYVLNGANNITIDHDFYAEDYTYDIQSEEMRMCDPFGQCTDFYKLIQM